MLAPGRERRARLVRGRRGERRISDEAVHRGLVPGDRRTQQEIPTLGDERRRRVGAAGAQRRGRGIERFDLGGGLVQAVAGTGRHGDARLDHRADVIGHAAVVEQHRQATGGNRIILLRGVQQRGPARHRRRARVRRWNRRGGRRGLVAHRSRGQLRFGIEAQPQRRRDRQRQQAGLARRGPGQQHAGERGTQASRPAPGPAPGLLLRTGAPLRHPRSTSSGREPQYPANCAAPHVAQPHRCARLTARRRRARLAR